MGTTNIINPAVVMTFYPVLTTPKSCTSDTTFHQFLVTHFTTLSEWFLPGELVDTDHPVVKSEVIPMKMLMKDEGYTAETIDILTQILDDAGFTGDHQVQ